MIDARFAPKADGVSPLSRGGFTLPELIVGVLLLGAGLVTVVGVLMASRQMLPGRELQVNGEQLPIAPSPSAFAQAVQLHGLFQERLTTARGVYVFGGEHRGLPTGASRLGGLPLALRALPTLDLGAVPNLPGDAVAFYEANRDRLGMTERGRSSADFTVIVVGPWRGALAAVSLLQIRARTLSVGAQNEQENFTRWDTELYDISGDNLKSSFLERANVAGAASVGACHYWFRYDEGRVAEEGPTLAVFPDPGLYAGARFQTSSESFTTAPELPPFSRFAYFLAVSP
jgi:hypothetical protein